MNKKRPDLPTMFDTYCEAYSIDDSELLSTVGKIPIDEMILKNKQAAYDYLQSDISIKKRLIWINKLYSDCRLKDYKPLLELLKENSKLIRRNIERIIRDKEKQIRPLLEQLYPELDEDTQNWATQFMKYWDYLRNSKKKVRLKNKQEALDYSSKHIKLYSTQQIAWLPQKLYTMIHWAGETDKEEYVPRHVIRYILGEYMTLPYPIRLNACDAVASFIDKKEWLSVLDKLLQYWLKNGAEALHKAILLPYCMYCSEAQMAQLRIQIRNWAKSTRKQLVAYSLSLLGLKASPIALITLNEWMELSINGMYRNAAQRAFRQVAIQKGLTMDELADHIIPTLGFNREGIRIVDYGPRTFRVTLLPDLTISVFDPEKQKEIKKLPAPSQKDDTEKAEEAHRELSGLKRFFNAQKNLQRVRLEHALKNGRSWAKEAWTTVFLENPVMRYISLGLIWGVYKDGKLQESFRYKEDGSLTTASEEAYSLPNDATISLVHPIDLDDETLAKWKKQLKDYGLVPLISQLNIPVYLLEEVEKEGDAITRFAGKAVGIGNMYDFLNDDISILITENVLHIIDRSINILTQLSFTNEKNSTILKEMYFSSMAEEEDINNLLLPKEERLPISSIPDRYISSIIDLLAKAYSL